MSDSSPLLELPAGQPELILRLRAKLDEYHQRTDPGRAPETQMDSICKFVVLGRLLRDGRVVTWDLSRELRTTYGPAFTVQAFDNACRVVADYCETGGSRNRGGTGLPQVA